MNSAEHERGRKAAQTHIDAGLHTSRSADDYATAVEQQPMQDDHARGFAARLREHASTLREMGR